MTRCSPRGIEWLAIITVLGVALPAAGDVFESSPDQTSTRIAFQCSKVSAFGCRKKDPEMEVFINSIAASFGVEAPCTLNRSVSLSYHDLEYFFNDNCLKKPLKIFDIRLNVSQITQEAAQSSCRMRTQKLSKVTVSYWCVSKSSVSVAPTQATTAHTVASRDAAESPRVEFTTVIHTLSPEITTDESALLLQSLLPLSSSISSSPSTVKVTFTTTNEKNGSSTSTSARPPTTGSTSGEIIEIRPATSSSAVSPSTSARPPTTGSTSGENIEIRPATSSSAVSPSTSARSPATGNTSGENTEIRPATSSSAVSPSTSARPPTTGSTSGENTEIRPATSSSAVSPSTSARPPATGNTYGENTEIRPTTSSSAVSSSTSARPPATRNTPGENTEIRPATSSSAGLRSTSARPPTTGNTSGENTEIRTATSSSAVSPLRSTRPPATGSTSGENTELRPATSSSAASTTAGVTVTRKIDLSVPTVPTVAHEIVNKSHSTRTPTNETYVPSNAVAGNEEWWHFFKTNEGIAVAMASLLVICLTISGLALMFCSRSPNKGTESSRSKLPSEAFVTTAAYNDQERGGNATKLGPEPETDARANVYVEAPEYRRPSSRSNSTFDEQSRTQLPANAWNFANGPNAHSSPGSFRDEPNDHYASMGDATEMLHVDERRASAHRPSATGIQSPSAVEMTNNPHAVRAIGGIDIAEDDSDRASQAPPTRQAEHFRADVTQQLPPNTQVDQERRASENPPQISWSASAGPQNATPGYQFPVTLNRRASETSMNTAM